MRRAHVVVILTFALGSRRGDRVSDEPSWTPDGKNIVYVTQDRGTNDIRVIPASGGDPIELTFDTDRHEMSPVVSPDGKGFAFVQFRGGIPTLYTADIAAGRLSAWKKVTVSPSRGKVPRCGSVTTAPMPAIAVSGRTMPAATRA